MPSGNSLVFDAGVVRSLKKPKRQGDARSIIRAGRWPNGDMLTGSDAATIARYLCPDVPRLRNKALPASSLR